MKQYSYLIKYFPSFSLIYPKKIIQIYSKSILKIEEATYIFAYYYFMFPCTAQYYQDTTEKMEKYGYKIIPKIR